MLHTKFRENRPAGSGEDFYRVFTIYGHGGHHGHVTSITSPDFHFLVPETFIKNLVQIGKVASEKIWFEFLYVHNLGPRSKNDLDLQSGVQKFRTQNRSGQPSDEVPPPPPPPN